jgi:hypothetical protein
MFISLFSAGSLAYMDKYNIHEEAPGLALLLGTRLEVKWLYGSSFLYPVELPRFLTGVHSLDLLWIYPWWSRFACSHCMCPSKLGIL